MRARAFLIFLAFVSGVPANAAESPQTFALYARALRHFNPRLDDGAAATLAAATIVEADRQAIDARLLVAVIAVESGWNPQARSRAGARGLGQFMPATATALGVDPDDPLQNVAAAARQLRLLLDRFSARGSLERYPLALAAYNAGAGAVRRYGGVPPYAETQRYVAAVMRLWDCLAGR